jgi:hypothetical protein
MRAAPPVSVRGSGGVAWRVVQSGLPALAAGVLACWVLNQAEAPVWPALAAALLAGGLAWRASRGTALELRWDGQQWLSDGVAVQMDVMLDFDRWLLLRLRPLPSVPPSLRGATRWQALNALEAGANWHALRTAAYGPLPPEATP